MEHKFFQLDRTPVELVGFDSFGDPVIAPHPTKTVSVVGCAECNMGLDEAVASPNCLGMDLEELLEER